MRIAFLVHQYLPHHVGGTETYVHSLCSRVVALGHDALVVTHREIEPTAVQGEIFRRSFNGTSVVEIGSNLSTEANIGEAEYDSVLMRDRMQAILEDWDPDVVHVAHLMRLTIGALEACQALRLPVVVSLVDFWALCPNATMLTEDGELCPGPSSTKERLRCVRALHGTEADSQTKRAVRSRPARIRGAIMRADSVIAFTPFLKDMFARNGFPPARIAVVPHGVEPSALHGYKAPPHSASHTRLLFIGSLVPHKGLHLVLEGLRRIPDAPVTLDVYGAVADSAYVRKLLNKDDPRVRFRGTFEGDRLGEVFSGAHYLVAPSIWYENAPLVVQAAASLGLPVLTHELGTLTNVIEHERNGLFVEPTPAAWARIIQDAHLRRDGWTRTKRTLGSMDDHFAWVLARYEELAAG